MKTKPILIILCLWHLWLGAQTPYYGELDITETYYYFDTTMLDTNLRKFDISKSTFYMSSATIYNDTVSYPKPWLSQNNGIIKLNNIPLSFSEMLSNYQDTVRRKDNAYQIWEYNSTDESRSFSINISNSMPDIESRHIIPNYIHTSNGLTLNYGNVNFADSVEIYIYDYNLPALMPIRKTIGANSNTFSISSNEITPYLNSHPSVIVSFVKEQLIAINEKQYKLIKRFNITRPVAVIE